MIQFNQVSYFLPQGFLFKNVRVQINNGDKIGLVGKNGAGAIYERIADDIKNFRGKINLNNKIINIDHDGSRVNSISTIDKVVEVRDNDIVISTIPLVSLLKMLGHKSNLKFRGVIIFYLDCLKKQVLPDGVSWQYFDSKEVNFTRI